jgi:3-methyladenine DNA glycosylase AlkD
MTAPLDDMTPPVVPVSSSATEHADAFVASHRGAAQALGRALAELIQDPEAFVLTLRSGLATLSDPAYLDGQRLVAPGIGTIHGVRNPLLAAVSASLGAGTRDDRATTLLFVADRLLHEDHLEAHWLAFDLLERTLSGEPERTWQLMRRAARTAGDWITIDTLAHAYAAGIALEPYRWSELEQLVYSPSRWERRLVGSTIATLTHGATGRTQAPTILASALPILGQLIGDAEPDVQKALSWAYRSLAALDRPAVTAALRQEAQTAATTDDGHRAWVIRDSLAKVDPADAGALRAMLDGVRKRPGAPATSAAAATVAAFGGMPDPAAHPEPPLR